MANRPSWTNIPQTNFAGPLAAFNSAADRMGRGIGGIGDVAEGYVERKKTENTDKAVQALMGAAPGERAELIKGFASSGVNLDGKQIMEAGFKLEQGDLAQEGMGLRRDAATYGREQDAKGEATAAEALAFNRDRLAKGDVIAAQKHADAQAQDAFSNRLKAAKYTSDNAFKIGAGLAPNINIPGSGSVQQSQSPIATQGNQLSQASGDVPAPGSRIEGILKTAEAGAALGDNDSIDFINNNFLMESNKAIGDPNTSSDDALSAIEEYAAGSDVISMGSLSPEQKSTLLRRKLVELDESHGESMDTLEGQMATISDGFKAVDAAGTQMTASQEVDTRKSLDAIQKAINTYGEEYGKFTDRMQFDLGDQNSSKSLAAQSQMGKLSAKAEELSAALTVRETARQDQAASDRGSYEKVLNHNENQSTILKAAGVDPKETSKWSKAYKNTIKLAGEIIDDYPQYGNKDLKNITELAMKNAGLTISDSLLGSKKISTKGGDTSDEAVKEAIHTEMRKIYDRAAGLNIVTGDKLDGVNTIMSAVEMDKRADDIRSTEAKRKSDALRVSEESAGKNTAQVELDSFLKEYLSTDKPGMKGAKGPTRYEKEDYATFKALQRAVEDEKDVRTSARQRLLDSGEEAMRKPKQSMWNRR